MSYGFKLLKSDGTVVMSTDNFGVQIVDDFIVSSGSSGSRTYPNLSYHNKIFGTTMSNIPGTVNHTSVAGHSFMSLTVTVGAGNVPTVYWNTSNAEGARTTAGTVPRSPGPAERQKPDTRIIILAG
jgi:hypothetical protein